MATSSVASRRDGPGMNETHSNLKKPLAITWAQIRKIQERVHFYSKQAEREKQQRTIGSKDLGHLLLPNAVADYKNALQRITNHNLTQSSFASESNGKFPLLPKLLPPESHLELSHCPLRPRGGTGCDDKETKFKIHPDKEVEISITVDSPDNVNISGPKTNTSKRVDNVVAEQCGEDDDDDDNDDSVKWELLADMMEQDDKMRDMITDIFFKYLFGTSLFPKEKPGPPEHGKCLVIEVHTKGSSNKGARNVQCTTEANDVKATQCAQNVQFTTQANDVKATQCAAGSRNPSSDIPQGTGQPPSCLTQEQIRQMLRTKLAEKAPVKLYSANNAQKILASRKVTMIKFEDLSKQEQEALTRQIEETKRKQTQPTIPQTKMGQCVEEAPCLTQEDVGGRLMGDLCSPSQRIPSSPDSLLLSTRYQALLNQQ